MSHLILRPPLSSPVPLLPPSPLPLEESRCLLVVPPDPLATPMAGVPLLVVVDDVVPTIAEEARLNRPFVVRSMDWAYHDVAWPYWTTARRTFACTPGRTTAGALCCSDPIHPYVVSLYLACQAGSASAQSTAASAQDSAAVPSGSCVPDCAMDSVDWILGSEVSRQHESRLEGGE